MAYLELLNRIATHLETTYGLDPPGARDAANELVQDCGLALILVKGLGESPRQTFCSGKPRPA